MRIHYAEPAQHDLRQIWVACAEHSGASVADALIDRIQETLSRTIGVFPGSGRSRPELGRTMRSFPVIPYVAFYRVKRRRVEIFRILHGHRDIRPPLISLLVAA